MCKKWFSRNGEHESFISRTFVDKTKVYIYIICFTYLDDDRITNELFIDLLKIPQLKIPNFSDHLSYTW